MPGRDKARPILPRSLQPGACNSVIAFVTYLGNLYSSIGQLANIYVDLQGAMAIFDRIFEYLDLVPDVREKPAWLRNVCAYCFNR